MGIYQSKFIDALRLGSDEEARALYFQRKKVRDSIETNVSLGPAHGENSVLHYAALHAMEWLYRELLVRGGKPDMRNGAARNCLHLVCMRKSRASSRATILRVTLEEGLVGMDKSHILREKDEDGNTALHLAASAGLRKCVELLLDNEADLYLTNKKEQTAADCAAVCKFNTIATLLETRMVFSAEDETNPAPPMEPDHTHLQELAEAPSGMRDSDLRSMKDQLLIETSELLGVSLFTSEALLRHHGWSKEQLLEAWMESPQDACEKAGVQMPTNLGTHNLDTPTVGGVGRGGTRGDEGQGEERECGVCVLPCSPDIEVPCGHFFCRDCWRQYLHQKIESGDTHSIVCPEYACFKLVPLEVIEAVVSREMAQRYLRFDIKAFVESHPTIRWCPHANCHRAVRLTTPPDNHGMAPQPTTVHCGNEHYFCWSCSSDPHMPVSCEDWKRWLDHIQEMAPRIGEKTASQLDDAASQRWLASRSKPCPKCRAPIEKTDGCNHMCCKKCKHDFCWVCLDEWKQHNTSTGGYFECNRYEVRRKADSQLQKHKEQVLEGVEEAEQLRRFIHYYERYKSHRESLQLEQPFLEKANSKTEELRASVAKLDSTRRYTVSLPLDMTFIEEAIRELLAARRVLIASYAYGYLLKGKQAQRMFENMQGTLEQVTELLAQVVARPYLRKPRAEIIRLTRECREKRVWLVKDCRALPDPTPPSRRRRRQRDLFRLGLEDSDSSGHSSPEPGHADVARWLRDLRIARSRPEDVEDELLTAMELSRQEHVERAQLDADTERAMQLSLADSLPAQPTAHSPLINATVRPARPVSAFYTPPPRTHEPTLLPFSRHAASVLPVRTSTQNPRQTSPPRVPLPPPRPDRLTPPSPVASSSSSPDSSSPGWDEEDMARALSLSLMDAPQPPSAVSETATEDRGVGQFVQLPPELRHLLRGNQRSGQNV